jgi:hypothetical protein
MRQASLKLKMYANNVNAINNNMANTIFNFMVWSGICLVVLYVVFLGTMVFNIVERKALEGQARSLANDVGDMELTYLSMSNKIDLELSHQMGFKETAARFTTRRTVGSNTNIKLANNEI